MYIESLISTKGTKNKSCKVGDKLYLIEYIRELNNTLTAVCQNKNDVFFLKEGQYVSIN